MCTRQAPAEHGSADIRLLCVAIGSKYRDKTAPRVAHDRLQHFRCVLGLTGPRPPAATSLLPPHAAVRGHASSEAAAHRDSYQGGMTGQRADTLRSRGEVQSKVRWSGAREAQGDGIALGLVHMHASSLSMSEKQSRPLAHHAAAPRLSPCEGSGGSSLLPSVKAAVSAGGALHAERFQAPSSAWGQWDEAGGVRKVDSRGGVYGGAHTALGMVSSSSHHSSAGAARVLEKSQRLLARLSSS